MRQRIQQRATGLTGVLTAALALLMTVAPMNAEAADRADGAAERVDVAVYGGTPAGIAAAISAAESGHEVLVIEPNRRIGGMVTNGLSHPDFRTLEGLTGLYLELTERAEAYYRYKYGPGSEQVETTYHGTHAEPHVNLLIFRRMLEEQGVRVSNRQWLTDVTVRKDSERRRIESIALVGPEGQARHVEAALFIDGTYEGDLMAKAGVDYRVGREARSEYGESLAPEEADGQVQGYNFRFVMTKDPDNRVRPSKPPGYDREDFVALLDVIDSGEIKAVFRRWNDCVYKAHTPVLPNGKYDINDVSRNPVRLSMPSINDAWPDGDRETRRRIFREHVRHNLGLLYFLQNDEAVPQKFRDEALQWGLCEDEFVETDHIPEQLYVREARRMVGQHVYTQGDTDYTSPDGARAILHEDAIASGDYSLNCHGTGHEGPRIGGKHTGEFYKGVPPYQVPYGVIVPQKHENLLVPVACSASHVGFSALRFEPLWTTMGQAAGLAAHLALDEGTPVQDVPARAIQRLMHQRGAATIYVSDVLPGDEDFAAVQWWGMRGGLHGLAPRPEGGPRGERLQSQYNAAYPAHDLKPDEPLDTDLRQRWEKLAREAGLAVEKLADASTRGAFIRRAYRLHQEKRGE